MTKIGSAHACLATVAVLAGLAGLAVHSQFVHPWSLDDSYISFIYARHFAEGHGFAFNVGERIEGFTTFLWVLLLGVLDWAGGGVDMEVLAIALGLGFSAATIVLVGVAGVLAPGLPRGAAPLAALSLGVTGYFTAWGVAMMEVPLAAFTVTAAFVASLWARAEGGGRGRWIAAGVLGALAGMTRPEFVLLFVVLAVDGAARWRRGGDRGVLWLALGFFALGAPYFAWRVWYFGQLLPNTFHAKAGVSWPVLLRGAAQALGFIGLSAPLLAGVAALALRPVRLGATGSGLLPGVVFLGLSVVHIIWVGGDWAPALRFHAPLAPMVCLLGAVGLLRCLPDRRAAALAAAFVAAHGVAGTYLSVEVRWRIAVENVWRGGKEAGKWMREGLEPDALIATNIVGAIPYFSRLHTIDMLGLNDAVIARTPVPDLGMGIPGHERGNGGYVLDRDPDYIQFGSAEGEPWFRSDREIVADPRFASYHTVRAIIHPALPPLVLQEHERMVPVASEADGKAFVRWRDREFDVVGAVEFPEWDGRGEAFQARRVRNSEIPASMAATGRRLSSGRLGNAPSGVTGERRSRSFEIPPRAMLFFTIAGGASGEVGVELLVDGEVVRFARGNDSDEPMAPRAFGLGPHAGRRGVIRLHDDGAEGWSRLHVEGFWIAVERDEP